MQSFTRISRTRGFSMLELMVAVTISMLLLMGVVALFVSSRASYETTERLSRIQENGRFALDQLTSDMRIAGFNGCARGAVTPARAEDFKINTLVNHTTDMRWNFSVPAQGFNATGSAWEPALDVTNFEPRPSATADVLILRIPRREVRALQLTNDQVGKTGPLVVGNVSPAPLANGDVAMITDCMARAIFRVTGYAGGQIQHGVVAQSTSSGVVLPGNSTDSLTHPFKAGAEIVPVATVIYYLAPGTTDATRLSLWRKTGGTVQSDEIAEGIERFEVQFGVDTTAPRDGRADTYVSAADVADWSAVLNAQVAILARSPEAYGNDRDNVTYTLFSAPAVIQAGPFADRHQRKVFSATVAVRNQIFD